jgi:hypothetical protein
VIPEHDVHATESTKPNPATAEITRDFPPAIDTDRVMHYSEAPGLQQAWEAMNASFTSMWDHRDPAAPNPVVDTYIASELCLPRGPQWNEAVVGILLAENMWFRDVPNYNGSSDLLFPAESIVGDVSAFIRHQARREHRTLVPIWSHRVGGRRLVSLDMPVGESGIRLHDLVASGTDPQDMVTALLPEDPRLASALETMEPEERAVALAWASWKVASWEEAALLAGVDNPAAMGERVRRKLKRLGRKLTTQEPGGAQ